MLNLNKLIHNMFVRVFSHAKYRDSSDPLYKGNLEILKLVDINKHLIGRFMFRCCNNSLPELFYSLFFLHNSDYHTYDTRTAHNFHITPVKTDSAKTRMKYREAINWNSVLSHRIYTGTTDGIFAELLKMVVE